MGKFNEIKVIEKRASNNPDYTILRLEQEFEREGHQANGDIPVFGPSFKSVRRVQVAVHNTKVGTLEESLKADTNNMVIKAIYSFKPHWLKGDHGATEDQTPSRIRKDDGTLSDDIRVGATTGRPVFIKHVLNEKGVYEDRSLLEGEAVTTLSRLTKAVNAPQQKVGA